MKKLSKSTRKHIRTEKARIRKEVMDQKEQKKLIDELYSVRKPISQPKSKDNKSDNKKKDLSNKIYPKVKKSNKIHPVK